MGKDTHKNQFLGGLAIGGPGVMHPEFTRLWETVYDLVDAWDSQLLSATEFAERLSLSVVVDSAGRRWTVGAESFSWFVKQSASWEQSPPPDIKVVPVSEVPPVLGDILIRKKAASLLYKPDDDGLLVVEQEQEHPIDPTAIPKTPPASGHFAKLSPLPDPASGSPDLSRLPPVDDLGDESPAGASPDASLWELDLDSVAVGVWDPSSPNTVSEDAQTGDFSAPTPTREVSENNVLPPDALFGSGGLVDEPVFKHPNSELFAEIDGIADDDLLARLLGEPMGDHGSDPRGGSTPDPLDPPN